MLRMPNPGSDITSFIRIFVELFEALVGKTSFTLDDMTRVLIERNLATSCGFMGEEALRLSTREDRSRDPLYNQSKMYSELYKTLGWINPTEESALIFQFTFLGAHLAQALKDPLALFEESLLGIVYPNRIIGITFDCTLRPFTTILKTIEEMDGHICRDELIIGPLSLDDDSNKRAFNTMVESLKSIRPNKRKLEAAINALSKKRDITYVTMGNYTRFPIASIKSVGWVESKRRRLYDRSTPVLELTEKGKKTIALINSSFDVRNTYIETLTPVEKSSLTRLGFYQMLRRAGFDLTPIETNLSKAIKSLEHLKENVSSLIFSPFQQLEPKYTRSVIGQPCSGEKYAITVDRDNLTSGKISEQAVTATSSHVTLEHQSEIVPTQETKITDLIKTKYEQLKSLSGVANDIKDNLIGANKEQFYPLIAALFRVLGYKCEHSRIGVNYSRSDALIEHPRDSMPIEIKSPGEEDCLSVKAVRQALENKIILLSRGPHKTQKQTTSLVVGYNFPRDRSEVSALINNIHKTFDITIGVIDLHSLLYLVASKVIENKSPKHSELCSLRGFIDVKTS